VAYPFNHEKPSVYKTKSMSQEVDKSDQVRIWYFENQDEDFDKYLYEIINGMQLEIT
jgi:hypothetical protein